MPGQIILFKRKRKIRKGEKYLRVDQSILLTSKYMTTWLIHLQVSYYLFKEGEGTNITPPRWGCLLVTNIGTGR